MLRIVSGWIKQYFSDEEAILLFILLIVGFSIIIFLGKTLAPVLTAIVLAYLLQGLVGAMVRRKVPELPAVFIVYTLFIGSVLAIIFILIPLTWGQLTLFFEEQAPLMLAEGQALMKMLPERYPEFITPEQAREWIGLVNRELGQLGQSVLTFSISNLPNAMAILIFVVLVPLLVFFMLKDKDLIIRSVADLLPPERPLLNRVWAEMNEQISNYVRGKVVEIIVVGVATYVTFVVFGMKYSALLGLLVGLSVVIPYIGAAVVTIPVAVVAYFQFGIGSEFWWVMVAYGVIQALDGNILVPLLFSEAVNLHPVAIIVSVLLFGGFWGLWGVFFAIPLATLIKAVLSAWPRDSDRQFEKVLSTELEG